MDIYDQASYEASAVLTRAYSTSFSMSIKLFSAELRPHIYAIYGLVRIGDEIVDSYKGDDTKQLLDRLEQETYQAIETGYSTNPIVHAFAKTARRYNIPQTLITPFFKSMQMDITPLTFDQDTYETYIYGSAEVVGLMCLKVFTDNDTLYEELLPSARRLGAAYQKINFLRDIAADSTQLGRWYFPESSAATFQEDTKATVIEDIEKDFAAASKGIDQLPSSARKAVGLSYTYYQALLEKIKATPAEVLLEKRVRISNIQKSKLLAQTAVFGSSVKGKQ